MSVSKWAYTPEKCDGHPCPGDCDHCPKAYEDESDKPTDLISRADAIDAVQTYLNILINSRRHGDDFTLINVLTEIRNKISALPSADTVSREFYEDAVKANIGLVIENRELKGQIESADAVQIHEDGTLEVKVPNAHKVGRVLVMDTDSHIGGGLFYRDDTEAVERSRR